MDSIQPKQDLKAVDKNISLIYEHRKKADETRRADQKFVDAVAEFAGSTSSLYAHFLIYILIWIVEPDLVFIGTVAAIEAIFLALFVLINQRRMDAVERKNADLHLQTSLLIEQEITQIARITDLLAKKMGIASGEVLQEVKKEVLPADVMKRISDHEEKA